MNDYTRIIRDTIQTEIGSFSRHARSAWREVSQQPVSPSPQQQFNDFMNMPPEVRIQELQQRGPEGYRAWVTENLERGEQVLGPAVWQMEPYFLNDLNGVPPSFEDLQSDPMDDLNSAIGDVLNSLE